MSPLTHWIGSWLIATHLTDNRRDCRLATLIGVAPDLDGLGLLADAVRNVMRGGDGFPYYERYHHFLLHGIAGGLVIAAAAAVFARRRSRVLWLGLLLFHLHLLCDLLGSRGPAPEDLWPIFYLGPFTKDPMWLWHGQWRLDGWVNQAIGLSLFGSALWLGIRRGETFMGTVNKRLDGLFVDVLRHWVGRWRPLPTPASRVRPRQPPRFP
jgi:hypothetical protein